MGTDPRLEALRARRAQRQAQQEDPRLAQLRAQREARRQAEELAQRAQASPAAVAARTPPTLPAMVATRPPGRRMPVAQQSPAESPAPPHRLPRPIELPGVGVPVDEGQPGTATTTASVSRPQPIQLPGVVVPIDDNEELSLWEELRRGFRRGGGHMLGSLGGQVRSNREGHGITPRFRFLDRALRSAAGAPTPAADAPAREGIARDGVPLPTLRYLRRGQDPEARAPVLEHVRRALDVPAETHAQRSERVGRCLAERGGEIAQAPGNQASASVRDGGVLQPRNPAWWAAGIAETAPQIVGQIGLAWASRGKSLPTQAASFAPTFMMEGGTQYNEIYDNLVAQGVPEEDAHHRAQGASILTGAVNAALEKTSIDRILPGEVLDDVVSRSIRARLARVARRAAEGFLSEGVTEMAQEVVSDVLQYAATGDEDTFAQLGERALAVGLVGGAVGGSLGGVSGAVEQPRPRAAATPAPATDPGVSLDPQEPELDEAEAAAAFERDFQDVRSGAAEIMGPATPASPPSAEPPGPDGVSPTYSAYSEGFQRAARDFPAFVDGQSDPDAYMAGYQAGEDYRIRKANGGPALPQPAPAAPSPATAPTTAEEEEIARPGASSPVLDPPAPAVGDGPQNLFGEQEEPVVEQAGIFSGGDFAAGDRAAADRVSSRRMNADEVAANTRAEGRQALPEQPGAVLFEDTDIDALLGGGNEDFTAGLEDGAPR